MITSLIFVLVEATAFFFHYLTKILDCEMNGIAPFDTKGNVLYRYMYMGIINAKI